MDQIIIQGPPLNGFGKNTKGTAQLEIGPRYKAIQGVIIATAAAGQTLGVPDFAAQINIMQGNKPQRSHTLDQLNQIQSKYGPDYAVKIYNYDGGAINYVNGVPQGPQVAKQTICYFTIWFSEVWRTNYPARDMFAWYTQWANPAGQIVASLNQFSLEVVGSNSANVDYTQPYTCVIYPETDLALGPVNAQGMPVNLISKWYQIPQNYSAAGIQQIQNLAKVDAYHELVFFCQPGDFISHLYLKVNGRILRDVDKTGNDVYLLGRGFDTTQLVRDRFDLVLDATDRPNDMLVAMSNGVPIRDLTLNVTLAAAAAGTKTFTILAGRYGTPD